MLEAGEAPADPDFTGGSKYKQILSIRAVHFLACWTVIYVGVEVTLGGKQEVPRNFHRVAEQTLCSGWIVTFIEDKRHGGPSAGYISSGFFGGEQFSLLID